MRVHQLHRWDLNVPEALELQRRLSRRVVIRPLEDSPRLVAGADAAYEIGGDRLWAAAVVYDLIEDRVIDEAVVRGRVNTAYRSGLLAFREGPALLELFQRLRSDPDVLLFDAHGLLHPRRLGMAAHLGLLLEKPSIGCAKSALVGRAEPLGNDFGDCSALLENGEILGYAVRTRVGVKPLFVSPGHLMDANSAVRIVLQCVKDVRIPEPLRRAHHMAVAFRREETVAGKSS